MDKNQLALLSAEIALCRICRDTPFHSIPLPHEPRPVCIISYTARIVICGQAPSLRVHHTGLPFNDPSGDRLRQWLNVSREQFYNSSLFAIVPMGFCFPGYDMHGSDLPPRRECQQIWHDRIFAQMPQLELVVAIGQYAQRYHLKEHRKASMTQTVLTWREAIHSSKKNRIIFPLPHPSWRNNGWLKRNPWFEKDLLPELQWFVQKYLKPTINQAYFNSDLG